jgi:hypothetical protein
MSLNLKGKAEYERSRLIRTKSEAKTHFEKRDLRKIHFKAIFKSQNCMFSFEERELSSNEIECCV